MEVLHLSAIYSPSEGVRGWSVITTHPQSGITNNRYMSNWLAFTIVGNPKRFISSSTQGT